MSRRTVAVGTAAALLAGGAATIAATNTPTVPPYAVGIDKGYETKVIMSVGDRTPVTSDPTKQFQMVGIPDGLGAHPNGDGTSTVFMNHELRNAALSEPVVGAPLNRGALVSKLVIDRSGKVLSGERAYDTVYQENTLVGPAPTVTNMTRAFSRFCSGSLAGIAEGFDRNIYFANEEDGTPANTFDGKGGQAVAIFDKEAHALPKLGRFAWENTLVQPRGDRRTVLMGMEDGPSDLDPAKENSQLYMYVGTKVRTKGATVLRRNGLDNGTLYVAVAKDGVSLGEQSFDERVAVKWVVIPNAGDLDAAQLEAASDAVGALRFARPEDGAFNPHNSNEFLFATTGGATGVNELGRLTSLRLHPKDPTRGAHLTVVYNADAIVAAGGDIAISPDNIGVSNRYLMINEDGTTESRATMAKKGRDGSIWRFRLDEEGVDADSAVRVAELKPPGRDGIAVGPGVWETSGIIDARGIVRGRSAWLFDVQAHAPTTAPVPNTVEDGQLLMMSRS